MARSAIGYIRGEVVELEALDWDFTDRPNGKKGTSYAVFVRAGSSRDGSTRVRCTEDQMRSFREGETVDLPCRFDVNDFEGRSASLQVTLARAYEHSPSNGLAYAGSTSLDDI